MAATSVLAEYGVVVGGEVVETGETVEICNPYDGAPIAVVHRAGPAEVERAIAGAVEAFETTRHLPAWRRSEILQAIKASNDKKIAREAVRKKSG